MCMNPYNSTLEIPILEYNSLSDLGQVQVHFGFISSQFDHVSADSIACICLAITLF